MSDIHAPFTNEQLTELALMQAENTVRIEKALATTAHQVLAGLVMNALLMHTLEHVGLVDQEAVTAEAIRRARSIQPPNVGASVAQVIKIIFDREAFAAPGSDFTGVNGSRPDAKH